VVVEASDPFLSWLDAPFPPADGFTPVDGKGGEVRAPARGRVIRVDADDLVMEHLFYENHVRVVIHSTLSGLDTVSPKVGDIVAGGAVIGTGRPTLSLSSEDDLSESAVPLSDPEAFVAAHRRLFVPQDEAVLALVSMDRQQMRIYDHGSQVGRYNVSFGQGYGRKERRGDNRTPLGMYFVTSKTTGPFEGWVGVFYGGHWIKFNYPNPWDATRGLGEGTITQPQADRIRESWSKRQLTLQDTKLGGGIGFHGWAEEWSDDGPRHLSWGCVVVHLRDIATVYAALPVGAMVVVF